MKREGYQHGMVRTYLSPENSRTINVVDSPPTAGIFTKVNFSKPTNQSKFSGRCGKPRCRVCHLHPACKSSEKTKGSLKLRGQNDDFSRLKLLTWRVVDSRPGLGMSFAKPSSASEILAQLDEKEEDEVENDDVEFEQDVGMDGGDEIEKEEEEKMDDGDEIEMVKEEKTDGGDGEGDRDSNETMGFCEVGYFWEQVEGDDNSWCWVAEM